MSLISEIQTRFHRLRNVNKEPVCVWRCECYCLAAKPMMAFKIPGLSLTLSRACTVPKNILAWIQWYNLKWFLWASAYPILSIKTSSLSSRSPLRSFTACLHNRKKHQWNRLNDVSVPGVKVGHCSQTCMFTIQPCPEILAENLTTKLLSSQTPTKLIQHSWIHTFVKVLNI